MAMAVRLWGCEAVKLRGCKDAKLRGFDGVMLWRWCICSLRSNETRVHAARSSTPLCKLRTPAATAPASSSRRWRPRAAAAVKASCSKGRWLPGQGDGG
eukprot:15439183-Alexandrium_andersonii.AAC.2